MASVDLTGRQEKEGAQSKWFHDKYAIDDYPLGTNAVVAVLAYTGYDMEDAMIVNKGSMERGLAHATLYKTGTYQISQIQRPLFYL